MRILLIGNGFDLEHELPTSYNDFLVFCNKVKLIYAYKKNTEASVFSKNVLDDWEIDNSIKIKLYNAFESRKFVYPSFEKGDLESKVIIADKRIEELHTLIKDNAWIGYFIKQSDVMRDSWIDFECEISRVVQILDECKYMLNCNERLQNIGQEKFEVVKNMSITSKWTLQEIFKDDATIGGFSVFLYKELEKLIRALEIYIADFVEKITVKKRSIDIEEIDPDCVLSFNYSNTYERLYGKGKEVVYNYIHGKADVRKNVASSNLVLGIDEYLEVDEKDKSLEFLAFKKFYQRIYKSTDNVYMDWANEIKESYIEFMKKEMDIYANVDKIEDGRFEKYPFQKKIFMKFASGKCPKHSLYIFGHSLDVTDRDVLRLLICNENVETKIFYYRKNEDDKSVLESLIRNLIYIMGTDELIRRTGGTHKTIEFIPQTI